MESASVSILVLAAVIVGTPLCEMSQKSAPDAEDVKGGCITPTWNTADAQIWGSKTN